MTAFLYESERYVPAGAQILGVSVEPTEEGKKFLERVTRDCREDRPHIPLDPYPLKLLTDPDTKLIRAVGAENEGHWAGLIAALSARRLIYFPPKSRWSATEGPGPLSFLYELPSQFCTR